MLIAGVSGTAVGVTGVADVRLQQTRGVCHPSTLCACIPTTHAHTHKQQKYQSRLLKTEFRPADNTATLFLVLRPCPGAGAHARGDAGAAPLPAAARAPPRLVERRRRRRRRDAREGRQRGDARQGASC